ncbi:hypothetical protein VTP01DRAFT_4892 [Rhizomucor pusillus]|uniref:uncharacterized protein n=1 Tax=Rhizomucor pusillus TaxID=4840 RepID=UPI0037446623
MNPLLSPREPSVPLPDPRSPSPSSSTGQDLNDTDYWHKMTDWLQELYTSSETPVFEKDAVTLHALQNLQQKAEAANAIMRNVLEANRKLGEENVRQAETWQERLDALEISKHSLSSQGRRALETLALTAIRLGINDSSAGSYSAAIAHLTIDTMDTQIEHQGLQDIEYALENRIQTAESELSRMKSMLSSLRERRESKDKTLVEHWKQDTTVLKQETEKTQLSYAKNQKLYEESGIEQHQLRLESLKKLEQDVTTLETEVAQQNELLSQYGDLPPDMVLALLKTKDAEKQLYGLQRERERMLADIAEGVH